LPTCHFADKLKKYFSAFGSVQDAVVMKDPISKRSRGFGFITFLDSQSLDKALANEPHTIDARPVRGSNLFVAAIIFFSVIL